MEDLLKSLEHYLEAKREHDEARAKGDPGYSWEYHGRPYIERMNRAAEDFGRRLEDYIDSRIEAATEARP